MNAPLGLRLVPITAGLLADFRVSAAGFDQLVGGSAGQTREWVGSILEQTVPFLEAVPRAAEWGCFLAVDDAAGRVVGTCGFKGGPDKGGAVEIAYGTAPDSEGRGVASAMVAELVRRAAGNGAARVIAHTLPEVDASGRVLERAGFTRVGDVIDPDDGPVWRWEREPLR